MVFKLKFTKVDGHWKLKRQERKDWWNDLTPQGKETLFAQEREAGWDGYWENGEWIVVGPCHIKFKRADKGTKYDRMYWTVQFEKAIPRTDPPVKSINYSWLEHGQHGARHLAERHRKHR